jgi:hypothetical protein
MKEQAQSRYLNKTLEMIYKLHTGLGYNLYIKVKPMFISINTPAYSSRGISMGNC